MPNTAILGEITKLETYIECLRSEIEGLEILPRLLFEYPIDSIALGMLSKAFALSRACLLLLRSDFPDEAYGLSRSIVEITLILRYITSNLDLQAKRAVQFLTYSVDFKNYWLYFARKAYEGKPEAEEIERYAKLYKLSGDPSKAQKHWSELRGFTREARKLNHPLDGLTIDDNFKSRSHAVDYFQTSQYVHCSQPAIDHYVPAEGRAFVISSSFFVGISTDQRVLYSVLNHLHATAAYALFALGMERQKSIDEAFHETLNDLERIRPAHSMQTQNSRDPKESCPQ